MKTTLFLLYLYLLVCCNYAEFCKRDDCRGGDCEITRRLNGSIKKICHCVKGVCGETCQRLCNVSSQCDANPCWFGGTCVDIANFDYICICPPNYTAKDCRTLVSCQANSCHNGGTCIQTAYGARCNCPANIRGDYCQYTSAKSIQTLPQIEYRQFDAETLAAIAGLGSSSASSHASNHRSNSIAIAVGNRSQFVFCLTNPCENDGTCFVTNAATTKGICVCREGYIGDYCENSDNRTSTTANVPEDGDYCSSSPCLHGGTCIETDDLNGYCRCKSDYRGATCQTPVRSAVCTPNPCKNGGTCILLDNHQAQCLCTSVFRGPTCSQFSYVPCGDATCHGAQGVCVSNKCVCKKGFAGPRCDSSDFCSAFPCMNGGTCIRTNEEPYGGCSCPAEFSGPTCSNDPCSPSPCLNNGYCVRKPDNQFYCQCRNRNKGVYCEQVECFPSDATVDVLEHGKVALSTLQIGAQVRVIDDKNQVGYSPIIAFLHHDPKEHSLFKRIRTKNARIELSNRHLIHRRSDDGFVWAEDLLVGDEVLVLNAKNNNGSNWEKILGITEVHKQGLMAPLTEQGTIVVNNVHASCYALVKYHYLGHVALAPYRWYQQMFGRSSDIQPAPILTYANVLLNFFKNLPIVKDLIF